MHLGVAITITIFAGVGLFVVVSLVNFGIGIRVGKMIERRRTGDG